MNEWINLKENPPTKIEGFVLGCDWYTGEEEDDYRTLICELPTFDAYWCGIKKDKAMRVFNSICPAIGYGHNAHWMEIPADNWIKFDHDTYPREELREVLIKLKNGNYYTGFIEVPRFRREWCPSFNMFKHGAIEEVEYWRELPAAPTYCQKPPLTEEEMAIQKEFLDKLYKEKEDVLE